MRGGAASIGAALLFACAAPRGPLTGPIAADRPGEATPPSVVPPGVVQVEGGVAFERRTGGGEPDTNEVVVPDLLVRFGLLPAAELQVAADGWILEQIEDAPDRSNGSDVAFGVKARFTASDGWTPALGARLLLSVPTGGRAVTSDGVDPDLDLLAQWDLSERTQVLVNAEFGIPSRGADASGRFFAFEPQIALQQAVGERVEVYLEYAGLFQTAGEDDEHVVDGGVAWLPLDDFQVDVSAGAGLDRSAPDFFVSIGGAWRFALPR